MAYSEHEPGQCRFHVKDEGDGHRHRRCPSQGCLGRRRRWYCTSRTDADGDVVTDKLNIRSNIQVRGSLPSVITASRIERAPTDRRVKIEIPIKFSMKLALRQRPSPTSTGKTGSMQRRAVLSPHCCPGAMTLRQVWVSLDR